jgi:peptidoglycan-associated lipoprotein
MEMFMRFGNTRVLLLSAVVAVAVSACARRNVVADAPVASKPPPPAPVAAAPAPVQNDDADLEAVLRDTVLYFALDDANLTSENQEKLRRLAEVLRKRSGAAVRIEGHCDARGTVEYNLALGHRRAQSARKYLVDLGVAPAVVDTVSFGSERPAVEGQNEQAWGQNRRAEIEPIRR